jgi:hypothetical protein
MLFPGENELFVGCGLVLNEKQVQLSNLDFYKILPKITDKPFKVMRYFELLEKQPSYFNIILYHFPGFTGRWVLFCVDDDKRKIYFFDPYGKGVDKQWKKLKGYDRYEKEYTILSDIVKNYEHHGYKYYWNMFNIQGHFIQDCLTKSCKVVAENECGELVCYRILYKDLNDIEFFNKCIEVGPSAVFKIIKDIEKI